MPTNKTNKAGKQQKADAEQLIRELKEAYAACDDERMETALLKLSECKQERRKAAAFLYQTIEYRPWDGKYYDPKSWRADVKAAIHKLYDSGELLNSLRARNTALTTEIHTELSQIFGEPLYVMEPPLNLRMESEKYTVLFADLLEKLVEIAAQCCSEKDMSAEEQLEHIEALDQQIAFLARELRDDKKYGSYRGVLENARRVRDALNNY